jgi:glycine/D-amino acid oxidase-like deaminating enzyme
MPEDWEILRDKCFWMGLDEYRPNAALTGNQNTDLVIVGGGFTGLWTAYHALKRIPGRRVTVLERDVVGYGASGRNGGFAMTLVHRSLKTLAAYVGDDAARRIYAMSKRAVEGVTQTIADEEIQCDAAAVGVTILSNTAPQDRRIALELETAERLGLGEDFVALDADAARQRIHSDTIRCGFYERHCTLVNPARLCRGLKLAIERLGATVYEGTPASAWEADGGGVTVTTPGGRVRAGQALLALNAYGAKHTDIRAGVIPFYTYICGTRVLTEAEWDSVGWQGREGVEDRRDGLHYFRPTADGRILWGGRDAPMRADGPSRRFDQDARQQRRLRETFEWFFPQLAHVPFEFHWGGPIGMTRDFLPVAGLFDKAAKRVAYAYGYNGHGVSTTYLVGNAVVDLLAGERTEWTDLYFIDRKPPQSGPIWLRNLITKIASDAAYRADDEQRKVVAPWSLRLADGVNRALSRFSRR